MGETPGEDFLRVRILQELAEQLRTMRVAGRSIGDLASEKVLADVMPEVAALQAENAALREIVDDAIVHWVGFMSVSADCPWCDEFHENYAPADPRPDTPHSARCFVTKARKLLGNGVL